MVIQVASMIREVDFGAGAGFDSFDVDSGVGTGFDSSDVDIKTSQMFVCSLNTIADDWFRPMSL